MNEVFEKLGDQELLALCIYGEARGQGLDGMLAVGSVVVNRALHPHWWGNNIKEVILKKWQFSCFNEGDPNRVILEGLARNFERNLRNMTLSACFWIAKGILAGRLMTNVGTATHYHHRLVKPAWRNNLKPITQVGDHLFYEEVQ